jgi:hypothetical protein
MAIFNGAPPAFQSTQAANTPVGTAAASVQVYNAGSATVVASGGTTYYAFPTGAVLSNLTLINVGTATAYLGGTGASSVTAAAGLALAPGQQLTIQGTAATGTTSTFNIWAITAAGANNNTSIEASLATVVVVD